jgi:transposase
VRVVDPRDARIAKLEAELEAALEREKRFGEIIAQQQTLIAAQQELIADLRKQLAAADAERAAAVARLEREVARLERELVGPKTERVKVPPIDLELIEEMTEEERARRREEAAAKRREHALAKNAILETEEVTHEVPDGTSCPKCSGTKFRHVDYETSAIFEYKPGRFVRRVHKRQKKACSCGEFIVTAPMPPKLVARGQYGFGFVAFLVVAKCVDSIPIARIEKRFARLGIPMARSTMNDLVHEAAELARPLVARLQARIAKLDVVLADETSMRLQDRAKRGFVWVFHGHDDASGGQLVLYVFAVDRSGGTPAKILGGTEGTLVVDGYTGYNVVTDPDGRRRAGCWSHLRRRLFEARATAPAQADHALELIRALFRVERDATEQGIVRTPAHLALRTAKSKPIVDEFFAWVEATRASTLPKSPLGEALSYAMNQRERLELFLTDARIPLHNNGSEARLRVVALGRKTYMFFGHPRAGRNFAGLYSLVGSAIANGIEPTEYLTDVFPRIRDATTDEQLDALLPDRWLPLSSMGGERAPPAGVTFRY